MLRVAVCCKVPGVGRCWSLCGRHSDWCVAALQTDRQTAVGVLLHAAVVQNAWTEHKVETQYLHIYITCIYTYINTYRSLTATLAQSKSVPFGVNSAIELKYISYIWE